MAHDFQAAAHKPLSDPAFRATFRKAMDGLMGKRAAQFADPAEWASTRALAESVRQRALAQLPTLLERLEERCTANGITVHWAETTDQANALVLEILQKHGARTVVKGKSMVTEEMHLNDFLDRHGIEATEADLGEYIVQMEGNGPAHIIMPAIHLNRQQIAQLFRDKLKTAVDNDEAAALTALARTVLREKFAHADAGISGVNFAVAETGSLCLIENEGNGRMATTIPPLHIAVMGIEKVVENLEDVAPLLSILPRSATGQPITTYFNVISGPRKANELDGPQEVHLVILDNGRANAYADEQLRQTLQCIRCGACMNHCPVYARVGGHAYGGPYPGPLGKILLPQIDGLEDKGDLPHASTLCNACVEVCPVRIPIADILVRLRAEASAAPGSGPSSSPGACGSKVTGAGARYSRVEDWVWRLWAKVFTSPRLYRLATWLAPRLLPLVPRHAPGLKAWTHCRTKPVLARKSLHHLAREEGIPDA
jgi:L-lactate dehydrogenase complex protein LldF